MDVIIFLHSFLCSKKELLLSLEKNGGKKLLSHVFKIGLKTTCNIMWICPEPTTYPQTTTDYYLHSIF